MTAAAAFVACGMLLGGSLPALAQDAPADEHALGTPPPHGPILGSVTQEQLEAAMEVTGWPTGSIFAGDTVTLSIHVDPLVLGAPSLEGALVGIGGLGEVLGFAQLDETNTAELQVRPLVTGPLELTPLFAGDEDANYAPAEADSGTVTVDPVPVTMTAWFDDEEDGELAVGGGGVIEANALVTPYCVDDADDEATDQCYATYGVPAGSLLVMQDGVVVAEVEVPGTRSDAMFALPGADLSEDAVAQFTLASVQLPDLTQGGVESFEMHREFAAANHFRSVVEGAVTVNMHAVQPELELYVAENWSDATTHRVNASSIPLAAYFQYPVEAAAPASGSVTFYVDGADVSGPLAIDGEDPVEYVWEPREGGTYEVLAAFTPDTMNHVGSVSETHTVSVIIPPVPNPFPNDDPAHDEPVDTDPSEADGQAPGGQDRDAETLAETGGEPAGWLALAAGVLIVLGAAGVALRPRIRTRD